MAATSASTLSAAEWNYRDNHDYGRAHELQAYIARDRASLNEDMRRGRWGAVRQDRVELARDQRQLDAQLHDVRHDWR